MNCCVCAVAGTEKFAAGICGVCSVGLCVIHRDEQARRRGLREAHPDDCLHSLGHHVDPPRITRIPIATIGHPLPAA